MIGNTPLYVLDTNVFIEAARRYYAFDIVPSFWTALVVHAQAARLISIDRVKDELDRGKDDLDAWACSYFAAHFVSTNEDPIIAAYRQLMGWAYSQSQFSNPAKAEFAAADNADAWVVAYAMVKGCTVVIHEGYDPQIKRKIPIPNVCRAVGAKYVDTFTMLRDLGVKLG